MIKRANEMTENIRKAMRGGDGQVIVRDFLSFGEYDGKARLLATLTLEPGCSIGKHIHENEEEIFYIIEGTATYDDNGKTFNEHYKKVREVFNYDELDKYMPKD